MSDPVIAVAIAPAEEPAVPAAAEGVAAAEAGAALAHTQAAAAELDAAERIRTHDEEQREWQGRQELMMADLAGRVGALSTAFQTFSAMMAEEISSIPRQSPPPLAATVTIDPTAEPEAIRVEAEPVEGPQRQKRRFLR